MFSRILRIFVIVSLLTVQQLSLYMIFKSITQAYLLTYRSGHISINELCVYYILHYINAFRVVFLKVSITYIFENIFWTFLLTLVLTYCTVQYNYKTHFSKVTHMTFSFYISDNLYLLAVGCFMTSLICYYLANDVINLVKC